MPVVAKATIENYAALHCKLYGRVPYRHGHVSSSAICGRVPYRYGYVSYCRVVPHSTVQYAVLVCSTYSALLHCGRAANE